MSRKPIIISLLCILFLAGCGTFPTIDGGDGLAPEASGRFVDNGDDVRLLVIDGDTRIILDDQGGNELVMPASTLKIATATMALATLRPDHRFTTLVLATGATHNGLVQGDLILVGGGDPLLDAGDLMGLALATKRQGITGVTGRFLYDEALFASAPVIDAGQPRDASYNPGISALSLAFNRARLTWDNRWRDPAIAPSPATALWPLDYGAGLAGPAGQISLPIKTPGGITAETFRYYARLNGIDLPSAEPGAASGDIRVLATHRSNPLGEIVQEGLEYSNNMVAELIGLGAVRSFGGDGSSLAHSGSAMQRWFAEKIPDENWAKAQMPNHSGLSSVARVTPRQMLSILYYGGDPLLSRLPVAGMDDGTSREWSHPDLSERLFAKSGTMRYVRGVVGRLYAKSGRALDVALYIQNPAARTLYDRQRHHEHQPTAAARAGDGWIAEAKAKEQLILLDLYNRY